MKGDIQGSIPLIIIGLIIIIVVLLLIIFFFGGMLIGLVSSGFGLLHKLTHAKEEFRF